MYVHAGYAEAGGSRMKCIECGAPARAIRGTEDQYSDHCSNECAVATWNRCIALNTIACVGDLTVEKIDEQLSTTGFSVEEPCKTH